VGCCVGTFLPFISQCKTSPFLTTHYLDSLDTELGGTSVSRHNIWEEAWGTSCC